MGSYRLAIVALLVFLAVPNLVFAEFNPYRDFINTYDDIGVHVGPGRTLLKSNSSVLEAGFHARRWVTMFHNRGWELEGSYFRDQYLDNGDFVDEYLAITLRHTWEWRINRRGNIPLYIGVGTGLAHVDANALLGCDWQFAQNAWLRIGKFQLSVIKHLSDLDFCSEPGQNWAGLRLNVFSKGR